MTALPAPARKRSAGASAQRRSAPKRRSWRSNALRRAARRLWPLALSLVLAGCTSSLVDYEPRVHVVQPGDTLFAIAWRYGLDYKDLARWNRLKNPDLIQVGQRIRLAPARGAPPASSASNRTARSSSSSAAARSSPAPSSAAGRPAPSSAPTVRSPSRRPRPSSSAPPPPAWHWPTAGTVVSRFGEQDGIPSGIGIGGRLGQPIEAAAAGRVVYAGSGLIGYGQLVIIRHNDTYLTAYGHNRRLLVAQGQAVVRGQKIAEMGYGPKREPRLHFEIRRDGTPVDPLQYVSAPSRVAGAR